MLDTHITRVSKNVKCTLIPHYSMVAFILRLVKVMLVFNTVLLGNTSMNKAEPYLDITGDCWVKMSSR